MTSYYECNYEIEPANAANFNLYGELSENMQEINKIGLNGYAIDCFAEYNVRNMDDSNISKIPQKYLMPRDNPADFAKGIPIECPPKPEKPPKFSYVKEKVETPRDPSAMTEKELKIQADMKAKDIIDEMHMAIIEAQGNIAHILTCMKQDLCAILPCNALPEEERILKNGNAHEIAAVLKVLMERSNRAAERIIVSSKFYAASNVMLRYKRENPDIDFSKYEKQFFFGAEKSDEAKKIGESDEKQNLIGNILLNSAESIKTPPESLPGGLKASKKLEAEANDCIDILNQLFPSNELFDEISDNFAVFPKNDSLNSQKKAKYACGDRVVSLTMAIAAHYMDAVGFEEEADKLLSASPKSWKVPPGAILKVLVLFSFSGEKMRPSTFKNKFAGYDIGLLLSNPEISLESLNASNISRVLERLGLCDSEAFTAKLAQKLLDVMELVSTRLHADTTSVSFYGEFKGKRDMKKGAKKSCKLAKKPEAKEENAEIAKPEAKEENAEIAKSEAKEESAEIAKPAYGHSKDHKDDCKQVNIGHIVDENGMIMYVKVMDGNTSDVSWNKYVVEYIQLNYDKLKGMTLVADSKLITQELVESMNSEGKSINFVSRMPFLFGNHLQTKSVDKACEDDASIKNGDAVRTEDGSLMLSQAKILEKLNNIMEKHIKACMEAKPKFFGSIKQIENYIKKISRKDPLFFDEYEAVFDPTLKYARKEGEKQPEPQIDEQRWRLQYNGTEKDEEQCRIYAENIEFHRIMEWEDIGKIGSGKNCSTYRACFKRLPLYGSEISVVVYESSAMAEKANQCLEFKQIGHIENVVKDINKSGRKSSIINNNDEKSVEGGARSGGISENAAKYENIEECVDEEDCENYANHAKYGNKADIENTIKRANPIVFDEPAKAGEYINAHKHADPLFIDNYSCEYLAETVNLPGAQPKNGPKRTRLKETWTVKYVGTIFDAEARDEYMRAKSHIVLISNDAKLNAKDMASFYKGQDVVERSFRQLKAPNLAYALYLHNPPRIKGLIAVYTIAQQISAIIAHFLKKGSEAYKEANNVSSIAFSHNRKLQNPSIEQFQKSANHVTFKKASDGTNDLLISSDNLDNLEDSKIFLELSGHTIEDVLEKLQFKQDQRS
jgi:transposase